MDQYFIWNNSVIKFLIVNGENMNRYDELIRLSLEWNEKINITAITDPDEFLEKNIMDSLAIVGSDVIERAERIMDLGTGGGYPGLPLAMNYPDKDFVLVDSVSKKLKVIDDICERLAIKNVKTIHGRVEDLGREKDLREGFDLVVSRAVANMSTLAEYALPFVKIGGCFAAYKTENAMEEISAANKAIEKLGGKLKRIDRVGVKNSGHLIVIVDKSVETPRVFPRKPGEAKKNPII